MTLNDIDLGGLKYAELQELKELVERRMEKLREQGVPALRGGSVTGACSSSLRRPASAACSSGKFRPSPSFLVAPVDAELGLQQTLEACV
jgi:hypothetical protein